MVEIRQVLVVTLTGEPAPDVVQALRGRFSLVPAALEHIDTNLCRRFNVILVDLGPDLALSNATARARLTALSGRPCLFLLGGPEDESRARLLGAEGTLTRPFRPAELPIKLQHLALRGRRAGLHGGAAGEIGSWSPIEGMRDAIGAGDTALSTAFAAIGNGLTPRLAPFVEVGEAFVAGIEQAASDIATLGLWLDTVRSHHSPTFRHSLTVTGNAVLFGLHLGVRTADLHRLAVAGLVHDIGKAVVPLEILDKPGALDPVEADLIRRHPEIGRELLAASPDVSDELVGVVAHHHEYLDGSGYPDGLRGSQVPDLVRIMTIADIFSALIEARSYKLALAQRPALDILDSMAAAGKLDQVLVRAFGTMVEASRSITPAEMTV